LASGAVKLSGELLLGEPKFKSKLSFADKV
jgi:hypothetical protein